MCNFEPDEHKKMLTENFGFQVSFLYTNSKRERILRLINHVCTISGDYGQIFEGVDYQAVAHCKESQSYFNKIKSLNENA